MNARNRIQQALRDIMEVEQANACQVYKGWDYDGVRVEYGWWYCPFNATPVYLGRNVDEALNHLEVAEE